MRETTNHLNEQILAADPDLAADRAHDRHTDADAAIDLGPIPSVDEFVGAEFDHHRDALMALMRHTNRRVDFDPIVHLQTGAVVGSEALAVFPGQLSTAAWFSVAHAIGVGVDLELSMLDAVLDRYLVETTGFVGVNTSADVLVDPRFLERLTDIHDDRVVIELTGQTSLPSLGRLRMALEKVLETGARLAIHVADLGPSSLRSITSLEPDVIKLDPNLTAGLAAGEDDTASARNFFERCRHDGIFVVAVGVERPEQLRSLEGKSVDAYQGWLARAERSATTLDRV
jgi:EAL domain-containing protein (putative c-di-GMP-specific phosphodiesterase class I)